MLDYTETLKSSVTRRTKLLRRKSVNHLSLFPLFGLYSVMFLCVGLLTEKDLLPGSGWVKWSVYEVLDIGQPLEGWKERSEDPGATRALGPRSPACQLLAAWGSSLQ